MQAWSKFEEDHLGGITEIEQNALKTRMNVNLFVIITSSLGKIKHLLNNKY